MKQITIKSILISILLGTMSCDRPVCNNENPLFEDNKPESKVYKDELVKQLGNVDQSNLTYWLQKYEEQKGNEYLYFHIQGDGLRAILVLKMNKWEKLENVRVKKGVSYNGVNLQICNSKFERILYQQNLFIKHLIE